jgi:hypothetical protein
MLLFERVLLGLDLFEYGLGFWFFVELVEYLRFSHLELITCLVLTLK